MQLERIAYENTGRFSSIVKDYLSQREDFRMYYNRFPSTRNAPAQIKQRLNQPLDREALVQVLKEQHLNPTSSQLDSLNRLSKDDTVTVTTGHQLCLFSGPAYFIYKICSTIKLALIWSNELEYDIVPIFWLASEDHDLEEVDHLTLFKKEVKWQTNQSGAVGRMELKGVGSALDQMEEILGEGEMAADIIAKLRAAYVEGVSLSAATRSLVQSLFGEYGVLILDADDVRLKRLFSDQIITELKESVIAKSIKDTNDALTKRGVKVQAHPRDINLFYLSEGKRSRIEREGDDFRIVGTEMLFSKEDILSQVEQDPSLFSPNVLMRPLYQEAILPNICVIGGGGELAYWMQLKKVFSTFSMVMPMVQLRNSVLLLKSSHMDLWNEAGFSTLDLFAPSDSIAKQFVKEGNKEDLDILLEKEDMLNAFDRLLKKSSRIDASLKQFTEGEMSRVKKSIENIEKKMLRAEKKKKEGKLKKLMKVQEFLFPGGALQERVMNIFELEMRSGMFLIENLIEVLDPLDPTLTLVITK